MDAYLIEIKSVANMMEGVNVRLLHMMEGVNVRLSENIMVYYMIKGIWGVLWSVVEQTTTSNLRGAGIKLATKGVKSQLQG